MNKISTILMYFKTECPIGCEYCFEDPDFVSIGKYDLTKMLKTLKNIHKKGDTVVLHGGEVLTLPLDVLETSFKEIFELNGRTAIQSSLAVLKSEHIQMFKKYETGIGVSVDGPPELNIMRGPRDQKRNFQYQDQLVQNMKTLREEKIGFGTITLLSKANGTPDKIDTLLDWAIKNKINGRFNAMFRPNHRDPAWADKWCLNADELTYAYKRMFDTMMENSIEHTLKWNPITDFIKNLLGTGNLGSCTVNRCDYTTTTCKTIMPDGNLARCDRCFQDGYYYRGNTKSFVRSDMLKQTECVDCRYFEICGGGCPATGANGDWRHKTEFCSTYYELYKYIEKVLRGIHPGRKLSIDIPDFYNKHKNGFRMGQPDNKNAKNTEKPKNIQPGQHGDWENHGDSAC